MTDKMTTKINLLFRLTALALATFASVAAKAADTFDPVTNRLTLESVTVAGQNYKAVAVTVNFFSLISVGFGAPVADTFDSNTNILTMGAVAYQGSIYNNVQVRINSYSIQSVAPAATYTGEVANAFNVLNAERQTCGFGVLAQNGSLDASAAAHVSYLVANIALTHNETPGRVGYTGTTPTDRMVANGYTGSVYTTNEVMAGGVNATAQSSVSNTSVRGLLSSPYHLRAMVDSYRELGMSIGNVSFGAIFVSDFGYKVVDGPQLTGSDDVNTYPCNGSTGVFSELRGESPNPVPGRDLSVKPIGTPVLVRVRDGNTLAVTGTSMIQVSNGSPIVLRPTVTAANDPNQTSGVSYFRSNEAYFAPDAALTPYTQYQVTVTGMNNGVNFTRAFTFTTGPRG